MCIDCFMSILILNLSNSPKEGSYISNQTNVGLVRRISKKMLCKAQMP